MTIYRANCKTPDPGKIDDFGDNFQNRLAGSCRADENIPKRVGARQKLPPKGRFYKDQEFCNWLYNNKTVDIASASVLALATSAVIIGIILVTNHNIVLRQIGSCVFVVGALMGGSGYLMQYQVNNDGGLKGHTVTQPDLKAYMPIYKQVKAQVNRVYDSICDL